MLQSALCLETLSRYWAEVLARVCSLAETRLCCAGLKWAGETDPGWEPKYQLVQNTWNL